MLHYKYPTKFTHIMDKEKWEASPPSKTKSWKFSAWRTDENISITGDTNINGDYTASERKWNPVLDMLHMTYFRGTLKRNNLMRPKVGNTLERENKPHQHRNDS